MLENIPERTDPILVGFPTPAAAAASPGVLLAATLQALREDRSFGAAPRPRPAIDRDDCEGAARAAGLTYASTDEPGITRRKAGKGFTYRDLDGSRISDPEVLKRIRSLVIPPAWKSVWICPDPDGHIQAVGLDERGRRQYRYHPRFREVRESVKFEHMIGFAEALPRMRLRIEADMMAPGHGRRQVLATVAHLLETTMIRVGNRAYAKENHSYGLTTLQNRHAKVEGAKLKLNFKGKSGKVWKLDVSDRRIARIVKSCQELPGQNLFQYVDEEGQPQAITSADVNAYLKEISGRDITAKDFRTWNGTVLAAVALTEIGRAQHQTGAKKNVTRAIEQVSTRLGNTPAICRKCYVHPDVLSAYLDGGFALEVPPPLGEGALALLRPEEAAVLAFLRGRAGRTQTTT